MGFLLRLLAAGDFTVAIMIGALALKQGMNGDMTGFAINTALCIADCYAGISLIGVIDDYENLE